MERFQKLVEEYKQSDEKRRSDMWLMFSGLRDRFDQMERRAKDIYPKFAIELCNTWCEDWRKSL